MCPMHETTEVVPLVHAAESNAITQPDGDASGQVDIVGNQQRLTVTELYHEALVPGPVIVIRE